MKEETEESSDAGVAGKVKDVAAQIWSQIDCDGLLERTGASGSEEDSVADLATQHR